MADVAYVGTAPAFAKQGGMGRGFKASMAIADMVINEGLPGDFEQKPKATAAFEAHKPITKTAGVGAT